MSNSAVPALNGAATSGVLDQRLSFDVQGVDALRRTVRSSPQEGMKQAAKQFEALFMQMVLKSMRDATPTEGLFGNEQEKMFTSMLDQQLTQNLSGRGLGLADAMYAQLSRYLPSDTPQATPASVLPALLTPLPLAATQPERPSTASPDLSLYEETAGQATLSRSVYSQAHVEQFVSRLLPAAQRASQESGVPAQLIMAQAALESGWGRREIRADDGRVSYNLFGIKAGKDWKGRVAETTTTEFVNGVSQKTRASFRAYESYEEAFSDYAKLIANNPRYANVRAAKTADEAAIGLQQSGYATDPQYSGKLIRIMKQIS
ncbi:MAG: flagellar assembly peptidoglycan hydrolase FlgJ [Rhodoferax sp.]|nr:flagellar assembly peptidoglycan hydrolase FlgJ [Rhodoferax sp.]